MTTNDPNAAPPPVPTDAAAQIAKLAAGPREWPKMIYPKNDDGEDDFTRGVVVNDELGEKQQLSNWENPKNAKAHNGEAEKRRVEEEKKRIEADVEAEKKAAADRASAAVGGDDGPARSAAATTAARTVAGEQGVSLPDGTAVDPGNITVNTQKPPGQQQPAASAPGSGSSSSDGAGKGKGSK